MKWFSRKKLKEEPAPMSSLEFLEKHKGNDTWCPDNVYARYCTFAINDTMKYLKNRFPGNPRIDEIITKLLHVNLDLCPIIEALRIIDSNNYDNGTSNLAKRRQADLAKMRQYRPGRKII